MKKRKMMKGRTACLRTMMDTQKSPTAVEPTITNKPDAFAVSLVAHDWRILMKFLIFIFFKRRPRLTLLTQTFELLPPRNHARDLTRNTLVFVNNTNQTSARFRFLSANRICLPWLFCCGHTLYMNHKVSKKKKISIVHKLILIVHWNTILQNDLDAVEACLLFLISEMKSHYWFLTCMKTL